MIYIQKRDEELVELLKRDDELAFKELYNRHWYTMYSIALQKLYRKDIAEELAQDLFLAVWQKRHSLNILNFKAYLSGAVKNSVIDYIRKNLHEAKYLEHLKRFVPEAHFSATEIVYFREFNDAVHASLAKLPEKTRMVFILNRFEHLTIREIALRLNLSEKAIEYHLSRSLHFLRCDLQEFQKISVFVMLMFF